ncbi:hypothetical protein [Polaribacter cellanae]|uniref:Uncharacterized protein n=1 Tax=Polaribacter cellanae TaxID=2818493 RepID=A0A975H6W6_9FLAO|nr:hypothetical protein [Polaribacter cellanae]QTE22438.1 hypothetical protein J3359_16795 [Polaribacter cellanae]
MDLEKIKISISVGNVLAMIISWDRNKSILMALVHGLFGWLYVIYYYVGKKEDKN